MTAGATANDLVDKQLDAFKDNFSKLNTSYARRRNLTRYDVLIIASMIEREASVDRERPLVAAVIYNRLKRGMPLGIDATIRYAENNWTRPLRVSELERDGPYNTRLNRGLPPTPIGNPGLASLRAAVNPANKSYLFYVRKPGKSGEHAFSSTDAQFQRDVKRYQDSRENK
jgi:peptidoglycan lytic transglycosylase G